MIKFTCILVLDYICHKILSNILNKPWYVNDALIFDWTRTKSVTESLEIEDRMELCFKG